MSDAKPKRSGREAGPTGIEEGSTAAPAATPVTEVSAAAVTALLPPSPGTVEPVLPPVPESAGPPTPTAAPAAAAVLSESGHDAWTAIAEMQAALAQGLEAMSVELTTVTRSDIAAATDAATAMLDARSFAETMEIAAGLMRRHADAVAEAGARLSQVGFQAAAAISRPFLARSPFAWPGGWTGGWPSGWSSGPIA
ncbi:MAG: phasin family protein [Thiohalocapsa sp.]